MFESFSKQSIFTSNFNFRLVCRFLLFVFIFAALEFFLYVFQVGIEDISKVPQDRLWLFCFELFFVSFSCPLLKYLFHYCKGLKNIRSENFFGLGILYIVNFLCSVYTIRVFAAFIIFFEFIFHIFEQLHINLAMGLILSVDFLHHLDL